MKKESRRTSKYLLLALILVAVFVLPGCRTRLTNNSEVSNVQYDEDGYMSDMYHMRRDELGLSTAERPLLPDFGSGESDENDDFGEGEEINYNPEDYQEDFSEPQTNTNTNTNTNTTTRRTTTTPTSPSRRSSSGSGTGKYRVTFDSDGGTPEKTIMTFEEGDKLAFPEKNPTKEGYTFKGWWTAPDDQGSQVTTNDKVKGKMTLYAHWTKNEKKPDPPKPTPDPPKVEKFEVTFTDGNGNNLSVQEIEKGKSATAPDDPTRPGYDFAGWDKDFSKITAKTVINAKWNKKEAKAYWEELFNDAAGKSNVDCYIDGVDDTAWIQDCDARIVKADKNPKYVLAFVEDVDSKKEEDQQYWRELQENSPESTVYLISVEALDDANMLAYQIRILNMIHDKEILKAEDAANDLGVTVKVKKYEMP
ncbi:MAG: InlB B-repeat-containing protein [Mogibacterium sp.]|nr:InlB B-repeat-containing protein [Mogibacterium sp.]